MAHDTPVSVCDALLGRHCVLTVPQWYIAGAPDENVMFHWCSCRDLASLALQFLHLPPASGYVA